MPKGPVGRFQVFALLQAARAQRLGLSLASAKSWGLNRAIFVAAAKRGFGAKKPAGPRKWKGLEEADQRAAARTYGEFFLGDDKAYKVELEGATLFTIGGEVQTPEAYQRQVQSRFGRIYREVWRQAQEIIAAFPREVLESGEEFFARVYRPRRDDLAQKWSRKVEETSRPGAPPRS